MEADFLLAAAWIVFLPAYVDLKRTELARYRERTGHQRGKPATSGPAAIVIRFTEAHYFRFRLPVCEQVGGISIPSYSTADARLAWTFWNHWELSAVGRNLLQPDHFEFASDPGPNVAIKGRFYRKLVWTSEEADASDAARLRWFPFRAPKSPRRRRFALLTAILLLSLSLSPVGSHNDLSQRIPVKAVYCTTRKIRRVARHRRSHSGNLGCGVLGRDPFGSALDATLAGEAIDNRKLAARRIASPRKATNCQILLSALRGVTDQGNPGSCG